MRILIALLFFTTAAWFVFGPSAASVPHTPAVEVSADQIDRAVARPFMQDPPTVRIGGVDQNCQNCHALFRSVADPYEVRHQHVDLVLEHGINNRCDNCHAVEDRDQLVLYGGKTVGYEQVELLCAKCHGPTYRDWTAGVHGKARGSWDVDAPERSPMGCTECHLPHRPAFASFEPLPAPRTLRMRATEPADGHGEHRSYNPLWTWREQDTARGEEQAGASHD